MHAPSPEEGTRGSENTSGADDDFDIPSPPDDEGSGGDFKLDRADPNVSRPNLFTRDDNDRLVMIMERYLPESSGRMKKDTWSKVAAEFGKYSATTVKRHWLQWLKPRLIQTYFTPAEMRELIRLDMEDRSRFRRSVAHTSQQNVPIEFARDAVHRVEERLRTCGYTVRTPQDIDALPDEILDEARPSPQRVAELFQEYQSRREERFE
jgi:hypothetical protein